jgi:large conductance mechanosensitive channel
MLRDFKQFILRGNVVDLAIGVAIGAAFTTVVNSFTKNLLTPLIAIPGSAASLADKKFTISGSEFRYGSFIDDIIAFLIIAAALFFFVVKPVNALMNRRKTEPDVESMVTDCPHCLSQIPVGASKCAFCTADLGAAA